MTLPRFAIHRPTTLAEAGELMNRLGDDAVVYAGGTELLLVMKLGFADYRHLVDVKGIAELSRLEIDEDDLLIGGGVTHRTIERSPVVRERWPALAEIHRRGPPAPADRPVADRRPGRRHRRPAARLPPGIALADRRGHHRRRPRHRPGAWLLPAEPHESVAAPLASARSALRGRPPVRVPIG